MSRAFVVTERFPRPPDRVWGALTNWKDAPRWMSGIDRLSVDGPTASGTKLTFHTRGKDRDAEIVACDERKLLVLRSVQGNVTADYRYELAPTADGHTEVTLCATCDVRGWMAPLAPLVRYAMRKADGAQLKALRELVDA